MRLATLSLLLLCLAIAGCSTFARFAGVVVDGDGQPIAGVTIAAVPYPLTGESPYIVDDATDVEGAFDEKVMSVSADYLELTFTADGYRTQTRLVADGSTSRVVMERQPQSVDQVRSVAGPAAAAEPDGE